MFSSYDRPTSQSLSTGQILHAALLSWISRAPSLSGPVPTALSAQPLTHLALSTCFLLPALQWSERSILPPLDFVRLIVLACLSVSPIETTTSCQVFPPKVDTNVIQVPSHLLALSDEVAPSIVPVSLCRFFFLLHRLPFRTLHTCTCIPAIHIHSHAVANIR